MVRSCGARCWSVRTQSVAVTESRKRDLICEEVLAGSSARLQCGRVFDFFYVAGLATHPYQHHCLPVLRGNKATLPALHDMLTGRMKIRDVQALFDATLRQQLQGPLGAV